MTANFSFIEPMKAMKVNELPVGNWLYEMKFDGYRALAFKADKEVRLISRNRKSFNDDYPVLVDSLKSLKTKSFTIDGEITALDENGRSSFQLLQGYGKAKHTPLVYYAFDGSGAKFVKCMFWSGEWSSPALCSQDRGPKLGSGCWLSG